MFPYEVVILLGLVADDLDQRGQNSNDVVRIRHQGVLVAALAAPLAPVAVAVVVVVVIVTEYLLLIVVGRKTEYQAH